ncbi:MAG: DNA (cytosine-5-)-methyltransferase [Desulfobulbaceae bacterium]|nr:DNA (cytosine-5-)-methyltransferase [Desulfobulbaceae bacterium]
MKTLKSDGRKLRRKKLAGNGLGQYRFNSFFAGIGGFDLGFERTGISPAFHCEINEFCNSVLRRHWPSLPNCDDINKLNVDQLPEAEVWCGGFPCQDVSVARGWLGRDGLKGKNSGLFYPFLEIVKQKLPQVVVLENVTGLLSSHRGHDFRTIITAFTELGYGVAWRVMNARYFGAPQSRPRVFICAWKGRADLALHALYEEERCASVRNARKGFITSTVCQHTGASVPLVGYCLAATSGRHTGTDWSRTYVAYYDKVRRLTPIECEGLQGFPTGWSLPKKDYPLCDDEIDTLRYHAIGNAVCVPVIEWIAARIVSGLSGEFSDFNVSKSLCTQSQKKINGTFEDFKNSSAKKLQDLHYDNKKAPSIRWTNGGAAYGEWHLTGSVSPAPNNPIEKRLIEIIEKRELEEKYFLSPNAAKGILRRVNRQGRTLFGPLYGALERLAAKTHNNDHCILDYCSKVASG